MKTIQTIALMRSTIILRRSLETCCHSNLAREVKKTMEHENNGYTNCNWHARYSHQRIGTGTGGVEKKRTNGGHPNYSIIKIVQNTEKDPGNLRRLVVTQTPAEDHQLTLV